MNSELLKLLHLIFLTISGIVAEFHSTVQSISENIAIFFNLFIFTLFKTSRQFNQNEKKFLRSDFIALYHRCIAFHDLEFQNFRISFLESFKLKVMQWYLFLKILLHSKNG